MLFQQRRGRHNLSRLAISALSDILFDPGALHSVQAICRQALYGSDAVIA
jgi:hypothetical protein